MASSLARSKLYAGLLHCPNVSVQLVGLILSETLAHLVCVPSHRYCEVSCCRHFCVILHQASL